MLGALFCKLCCISEIWRTLTSLTCAQNRSRSTLVKCGWIPAQYPLKRRASSRAPSPQRKVPPSTAASLKGRAMIIREEPTTNAPKNLNGILSSNIETCFMNQSSDAFAALISLDFMKFVSARLNPPALPGERQRFYTLIYRSKFINVYLSGH